ncbi:MAG TPA: hypothetical protein DCW29_14565 [Janthinobacterium sp.]|nr:hypothetical protein [Janthinobacterium sp.]
MSKHTLCLHLGPRRLSAVVRRAGRAVPGSATELAIDNPGTHWQLPLDALHGFLARPSQAGAGAGLPLALSLSNHWCRMSLAPWSDALLTEAGAARFLQTQMAAVYGEAARGWSIAADDAPYGQPRLVCGIDPELLQGVQAVARANGHACHAVEALLSVAGRAIAPAKPRAFALVEPGRLVLAALAGGRIVAVQTQNCPPAWQAELAQAWQRWTLRAPELAGIDEVAVLDLSGAPAAELAPRFKLAPLAAPELMGESIWA